MIEVVERSFAERQHILQQASRRHLAGEITWVERRVISERNGPFRSHFTAGRQKNTESLGGEEPRATETRL